MTNPDWVEDLLKEKSLQEISRKAGKFTGSPFDNKARWLFRVVYPILIGALFATQFSPNQEALMVKTLASNLVAYSITVLGFLIAGLAVFTTLSEKKIWIALAQSPMPDVGVSAFKYLFFNMLSVFVIFLGTVVVSIFVSVAASADMSLPNIVFLGWQLETSSFINAMVLIFASILFVESTIRLKNFIWNIYSTFISMLTVKWLLEEDRGGSPPDD